MPPRYSALARLLPDDEDWRVAELLERLGFRLWHPALRGVNAAGMLQLSRGL